MNCVSRYPYLNFLLLAITAMLFVSCSPTVTDASSDTADLGYPAPARDRQVTMEPYPAPVYGDGDSSPIVGPGPQTGQELVPWPTFTPLPTPTLSRDATPTPIPLLEPATSASGQITFMEQPHDGSIIPFKIAVDESGIGNALPEQVSSKSIGASEPIEVYPSPDGSRIILTNGWGVRFILDVNSGQSRLLFEGELDPKGQSFCWHPDSRHFLMEAEDGSKDTGLWLVDVETGEHTVLLHQFPSPHITAGAVSPDGQSVIYALDVNGIYEAWMIDVFGGNARKVWESNTSLSLFSWSPDGQRLAMNGGRIMDMQSYQVTTMTRNMASGFGHAFRPVWSPDSRYVAFVAFDGPNPLTDTSMPQQGFNKDIFQGTNIHVLNVETGEEKALLPSQGTGNIDPVWSPDGSQIAFASIMSGNSEIWVINSDGTNLRQLTESGTHVRFPFWSSD